MLMAHVKKHDLREYWSNDDIIKTPVFGRFMSRDRYRAIYKFMHFSPMVGPVPDDRLFKIRSLMTMLQENITKCFRPYQKLVIDESLILFRGRLGFIQYIPLKRHRFGLKFFVLCDCQTGYVLDFIIYTGTDVDIRQDDPHGFSGAVVKALIDRYFKANHILYTDNYYTSPALTQYLLREETGTCGTVRQNRRHWPAFPNLPRGATALKESGPMLALKWVDKRPVNMLSTVHKGEMVDTGKVDRRTREPVKKPDAVIDYVQNMRLVDKSDMMVAEIDCLRKTRKWYRKAFLHFVDIAVLNSFLLRQQVTQDKKLSLRKFERELIRQLLTTHGREWRGPRPADLSNRLAATEYMAAHRLQLNPPSGQRQVGYKRCFVCFNTTRRQKKRTETRYSCPTCNVALCPGDCFTQYHTLEHF